MDYDTSITDNLFSFEEIDLLNQLIAEHCKNPERVVKSESGAYYTVGNDAEALIKSKVYSCYDDNLILNITMYDTHSPAYPHLDISSSGPDYSAYTFIIPLDTYNAHTIVFNEKVKSTETYVEYLKITTPYSPFRIDRAFYKQYLSHMMPTDIDRLSVELVYPWTKGSMVAFDRYKLHCSDNFLKNGLTNKKGIVIWSELKP